MDGNPKVRVKGGCIITQISFNVDYYFHVNDRNTT